MSNVIDLLIESDRLSAQLTLRRKRPEHVLDGRSFSAELNVSAGFLQCDLTEGELRQIRDWIDHALAAEAQRSAA